jgi:hypothetical protein
MNEFNNRRSLLLLTKSRHLVDDDESESTNFPAFDFKIKADKT